MEVSSQQGAGTWDQAWAFPLPCRGEDIHTHARMHAQDRLYATNAAREPSTSLPLLHIPSCMHVNSDRPRFRSHFHYLGYLTEFQFLHQHKLYFSCTSIFLLLSFICSVNKLLLSTNHVIIESVSWPRHIMTAL